MSPLKHDTPLRRWRIAQDFTLDEVSGLTGVSVAMLSRVERGQREMSPQLKVQVARRLGVSVREIFEVDEAQAS